MTENGSVPVRKGWSRFWWFIVAFALWVVSALAGLLLILVSPSTTDIRPDGVIEVYNGWVKIVCCMVGGLLPVPGVVYVCHDSRLGPGALGGFVLFLCGQFAFALGTAFQESDVLVDPMGFEVGASSRDGATRSRYQFSDIDYVVLREFGEWRKTKRGSSFDLERRIAGVLVPGSVEREIVRRKFLHLKSGEEQQLNFDDVVSGGSEVIDKALKNYGVVTKPLEKGKDVWTAEALEAIKGTSLEKVVHP